ncbi:MAG: hypothetical protein PHF29_09265 [Candidatus Riflebacteria bacterium]|nr:hypothetical protein [Candidatus Riflebacteria bacterium]
MLEVQTNYHIDGCVYVGFTLNSKTGEAWLQLPSSQTSRHNIELDGNELDIGGGLHQWILDGLLVELHQLYPDKVIRHLFYAGCDVDNVKSITEEWEKGWRYYIVELNDGTIERYEEVPGDVNEDDFYFVKEE